MARDLVNALIDLLNVQNDFLSVWVDHEVQRLRLDFDLGIMELDGHGLRIEHEQPLKTFLAELPNSAPFELPAPCEGVVADPCVPVAAADEDTIETLPEPPVLEIPPAMARGHRRTDDAAPPAAAARRSHPVATRRRRSGCQADIAGLPGITPWFRIQPAERE